MTLGELIARLCELQKEGYGEDPVQTADGQSPGEGATYRGHYKDIAFSTDGDNTTVSGFLQEAERCLDTTMEGYKGGGFLMHKDVDVFFANWGRSSDKVVAGLDPQDSGIVLLQLKEDEW